MVFLHISSVYEKSKREKVRRKKVIRKTEGEAKKKT
jgi:hypothetical protein